MELLQSQHPSRYGGKDSNRQNLNISLHHIVIMMPVWAVVVVVVAPAVVQQWSSIVYVDYQ